MALERKEFENQYRDLLPRLTPEERVMLELACCVRQNGRSSPVELPAVRTAAREQLWKRVQKKLANQRGRRGYGNG
ncbi:MAG: hypothetical protein HYT47_02930 [Candidatus Vogelbacteria bacterium]|nr:hypothetical protein [Candidatus Vogelbacteria bacterium]